MTGSAIVLQGDCLDLMKSIPTGVIDAVIADPPYGTTANKWDAAIPFGLMWQQLLRVGKEDAAFVLHACPPFSSALVMSNPQHFRHEWIWEKEAGTGFLNAKKSPLRSHESILVFYRTQPTYTPQMELGAPYTAKKGRGTANYNADSKPEIVTVNTGFRYPKTVLRFNRDKSKLHPTQKPVDLMRYLIRTYTNAGDRVLDFTCGSGSTGVAAVLEGRKFLGIEREPKYVAIARERIAQAERDTAA